jgi:hypothetical protein
MAETLSQQQRRFARLVGLLIGQAHEMGYEVTLGDAYRDPRVFGPLGVQRGYGHAKSAHKQRLAIDLNLWVGGEYREDTDAHRPLGEWWERQASDARWGGRFGDGNHYSLERGGIR